MEHLNEEKRMKTMTNLDLDSVKLELKLLNLRKRTSDNLNKEIQQSTFRSMMTKEADDLDIAGSCLLKTKFILSIIDEEKNELPIRFIPRDINNSLDWKKLTEGSPRSKRKVVSIAVDVDAVPKRRTNRLATLELHEMSPTHGNTEGEKSPSPTRRKGMNPKVIFL
jgi:hypothetical protein